MTELSSREKELKLKKFEQTMKLRAEFLKQVSNPYRHALGEGGTVFDPALARFQAMNVSHFQHFKPNFLTFRKGMVILVLPILFSAWVFRVERDAKERAYRNGEVSYRDRKFKFV